jgi:hypothetical protein
VAKKSQFASFWSVRASFSRRSGLTGFWAVFLSFFPSLSQWHRREIRFLLEFGVFFFTAHIFLLLLLLARLWGPHQAGIEQQQCDVTTSDGTDFLLLLEEKFALAAAVRWRHMDSNE